MGDVLRLLRRPRGSGGASAGPTAPGAAGRAGGEGVRRKLGQARVELLNRSDRCSKWQIGFDFALLSKNGSGMRRSCAIRMCSAWTPSCLFRTQTPCEAGGQTQATRPSFIFKHIRSHNSVQLRVDPYSGCVDRSCGDYLDLDNVGFFGAWAGRDLF